MSLLHIPALLVSYARKDNILNLVDQFFKISDSTLYIHIDKAKSSKIGEIQSELKNSLFKHENRNRIMILETTNNLGVKRAVISALDWFFESEDFGVIIEDDLKLTTDFYEFVDMNKQLLYDDESILMLSGNKLFNDNQNYFATFTNYPQIWGWATTRKNWLMLKKAYAEVDFYKKSKIRFRVKQFWKIGSWRVKCGKLDTWDIPIARYMLMENKYCLLPNENLVENIGDDEFASHTKEFTQNLTLNLGALTNYKGLTTEDRYSVSKKINRILEDDVFKIKFKHSFLFLVLFFETIILKLKKLFITTKVP